MHLLLPLNIQIAVGREAGKKMCVHNFDRYYYVIFHREGTKVTLLLAMYEEAYTPATSGDISLSDLCYSKM